MSRDRAGSLSDYRSLDDALVGEGVEQPLQPSPSFAMQPLETRRVHAQSIGGEFGPVYTAEAAAQAKAAGALPAVLSREDVIQSARRFQVLKPINPSRIKWNLLWLAVIWAVFMFPIYAPFIMHCSSAFYGTALMLIFLALVWLVAIGFTAYYIYFLYKGMDVDYKLQYPKEAKCFHIIILTIYKDDMEVVMRTIASIAKQTEAKERIVMVLGWEGRTPDREERTAQVRGAFSDSFHQLLFSVHPYQLPHEIASKAANANWALRYATRHMFQRVGHHNADNFMVTTCDSDTLFHERYFESLTADYLRMRKAQHPQTYTTIWQAPLFYNWALDQSSFVTRITGLLRTTMTMGCLIPFSVNPMSCFSFSLNLAIRGGYWHPQIFMDDVGFLLTMQIGAQTRVNMRCLPVPVLSGPTSGATWALDVYEWYVQVRRWAIGTADNYHFMCVKLNCLPWSAALTFTLGYFLYYGVILCSGPLFSFNASCIYPFICKDDSGKDWADGPSLAWLRDIHIGSHELTPSKVLMFLSIIPYLFYGGMFILDAVWVRIILHMQEDISLPRNILHWILVGPSMLMYSLVQLHGYNVLAVKGKVGACVHQLAGKATLGAGQGLGGTTGAAEAAARLNPGCDVPMSPSAIASHMADEAFNNDDAAMAAAENGKA